MESKGSAPGSIMLLGEYAVLRGLPALVGALNKRIEVNLSSRTDDNIVIHSDTLGEYITTRQHLVIKQPFAFVLAALRYYQDALSCGLNIQIVSDFSANLGLGSSAAVTVATLRALHGFLKKKTSSMALIKKAIAVIRAVQGAGSGADVAASVMGGVVAYQCAPLSAWTLSTKPSIAVVYSGKKASTVQALGKVITHCQQNAKYAAILRAIAQCALAGKRAIQTTDWQQLGAVCNQQQLLMQDLGVSNALLNQLIKQLQSIPTVFGAKISGAGFGDCVLAIGELPRQYFPRDNEQARLGVQQLDVQLSTEGVRCATG